MKQLITPLLCLLSIPVLGQAVYLDPNFGSSGIAITPNTTEINSIATDPDGFIYSGGYSLESGGTGIYRLTITKHTNTGTLVSSFGTNGITTTEIDYSEFPLEIKLQADGKILVCGSIYLGPTQSGPGDHNSFIVRYKTNGELDSSFAVNGVLKLSYPDSHLVSIMPLSDGSIVVAGNSYGSGTISKINANGVIDPSFGNNGLVFLSGANFQFILWEAMILNDQSIICVGYDATDPGNSRLAYCKVDLNGDFVPTFGQNGKVVMDLYNTMPEITEFLSMVKENATGDVFIGGQASGPVILKVNPADGTLNTTFGNNGILHHPYPFADMEIQADGKFLIGGSHEITEYNAGFSVTRLNSDGSLDQSFNGTGTFTADISPENDYLQALKLVGTSEILVGGSSRLPGTNADFMLAKIDISQSLNLESLALKGILVYPNPVTNEIHLIFNQPLDSPITLTVTDNTGRCLIQETRQNTNDVLVDLSAVQAGNYFISLVIHDTKNTFSIIKK